MSTLGCINSTSTTSSIATLSTAAARVVVRSHPLYFNYVVRHDYSFPGRTSSTSTTPCAATTRLPVARALPQPCHAPSCRSTSRWSVALALVVRPVTTSRGANTRCPDCTSYTAPMLCIRMRRLAARFLVGRSHWLSPCVRSLRLAARLLVVQIAPTLYVVHPDAWSGRSTSRRSVALALAVRPIAASRGVTTRRPDCTGSTVPMPCIRTRRLDARLLVSRSHWLSPCAWSFRCAS
jgi:hypothetical protein